MGFWGSRPTSLSLPHDEGVLRPQASTPSMQTRSHAEASMLRHSYGSSLRRLVSAPLAIKSPIPHGGAWVLQNKSRRCFHWTRRRSQRNTNHSAQVLVTRRDSESGESPGTTLWGTMAMVARRAAVCNNTTCEP